MTKAQGWMIIGLLVIFLGWTVFLWGNPNSSNNRNSVIMYPVQCSGFNIINFLDCKSPIALEQSEYFLDNDNQSVSVSYPSEPNSTLEHRTDCTIVDSSNWSCGGNEAPPLGGFGVKNDVYFSGGWSTDNGQLSIIYVRKSQWDSINHGQDGPF